MKVYAKPVARLDGRWVHVEFQPERDLGEHAEWLLSDESAAVLRDELVRILADGGGT